MIQRLPAWRLAGTNSLVTTPKVCGLVTLMLGSLNMT